MLIERPDVFPLVAIVAILLFFAKEGVELFRRRGIRRRKLFAIRQLIAAECERNNWSIARLHRQTKKLHEALQLEEEIRIVFGRDGRERLEFWREGSLSGSSPVEEIHFEFLQQFLFEAASLDDQLFAFMQIAMDELRDAYHVRSSLIRYVSEDQKLLNGFPKYATKELAQASDAIGKLYSHCTGERLVNHRVR